MSITSTLTAFPNGGGSWSNAVLLLSVLSLIYLSCFRTGRKSERRNDTTIAPASHPQDLEVHEAKGSAQQIRQQRNCAPAHEHDHRTQLPAPKRKTNWTAEKSMRVLCSIVILAAAMYIIVFDREANSDRQKWAFGAVGLVFGHWAKG